jgi:hypothetical protein
LGGCYVKPSERNWSYVYSDLSEDFISQDYIVNCTITPDENIITVKDKGGHHVTDTIIISELFSEIRLLNKGICDY